MLFISCFVIRFSIISTKSGQISSGDILIPTLKWIGKCSGGGFPSGGATDREDPRPLMYNIYGCDNKKQGHVLGTLSGSASRSLPLPLRPFFRLLLVTFKWQWKCFLPLPVAGWLVARCSLIQLHQHFHCGQQQEAQRPTELNINHTQFTNISQCCVIPF